MARVVSGVLAGVALTLVVVFGVAAQSDTLAAVVKPFVVSVTQAVPVDLTLSVTTEDGEEIEVTTPITVGVNLQIQIDGLDNVTVNAGGAQPVAVSVKPVVTDQENVDDLGIPYTIAMDSEDIEFTEWTAYSDENDWFKISGVVEQKPGTDPIDEIIATVRYYDSNGKLIGVGEIHDIDYNLEAGGKNRFDHNNSSMKAADIGSYKVEIEVIR